MTDKPVYRFEDFAEDRDMLEGMGIHLAAAGYIDSDWLRMAGDRALQHAMYAMDAQPGIVTTPNAGVLGYVTNLIDPQAVNVLLTPIKMAAVIGEQQKGDWTTLTTQFRMQEMAGQVTSYGDYNNDGNVDINQTWVPRSQYYFQTIERYGERDMALAGRGGLDYKAGLDMAAMLVFRKFFNRSYIFGVNGMQLYGMLTDPSLPAAITPTTKAAGGTLWGTNNATAQEMFNDINLMFGTLISQLGGLELDASSELVLILPPLVVPYLNRVSQFNVSALQTIKGTFPNLRIETVPEYATPSGNYAQLILMDIDGVNTAYGAYSDRMRAHAVIPDVSSWKQKKSGGTWGAIIRRPLAIVTMAGF